MNAKKVFADVTIGVRNRTPTLQRIGKWNEFGGAALQRIEKWNEFLEKRLRIECKKDFYILLTLYPARYTL